MSKTVVVYHSGYGHTQRQAQVIAEAAGGQLIAIDADGNIPEAAWAQLDAADAIVFGSPTYMGAASWQFKKFADASSKPWYSRNWKDKIFAGFTNSASMNGDKQSTLNYLCTLAMQHGGVWVGLGVMPSNSKAAQRKAVDSDKLALSNVNQRVNSQPEFDRSKVEAIKESLKNGSYPLNPRRIAESFVALEQMITG